VIPHILLRCCSYSALGLLLSLFIDGFMSEDWGSKHPHRFIFVIGGMGLCTCFWKYSANGKLFLEQPT
jgi:hypothetical protein